MSDTTIVDVARMAGVGIGTVSRVINRGPSVRPATAALVRQAMEHLGYIPPKPERRRGPRIGKVRNKVDQSVMMLIMGGQGLKWILNCAPVYSNVLHGVEAALAEAGRNMIFRHATDWKSVRDILPRNRVEGVIVLGSDSDIPSSGPLREIPVVWTMGTPRLFQGDHVHPDNMKSGVLAARYLLEQGHTRCAYLGSHSGSKTGADWARSESFARTLLEAGAQVEMLLDPGLVIRSRETNAVDENVLANQLDRLLSVTPRITALMVQADMFAPSVYRQLLARGICPQRDIAIVTCNNERPYLNALHPAPVVIDLQAEMIGRRTVDQLLWRVQHPNDPPMRVMIAPTLVLPPNDAHSPAIGNGEHNGEHNGVSKS